MECAACKYEYTEIWERLKDGSFKPKITKGDQRFNKLIPNVLKIERKSYCYPDTEISLYACPKCHTVRIET